MSKTLKRDAKTKEFKNFVISWKLYIVTNILSFLITPMEDLDESQPLTCKGPFAKYQHEDRAFYLLQRLGSKHCYKFLKKGFFYNFAIVLHYR